MSSTGVPWDREPEYMAACRTRLQPGEPSPYIPTPLTGASSTDVTGFQIGSAHWNIDNLPNVCYVLNPPVEWDIFRKSPRPAQKLDESGYRMWERHPWPRTAARPLLDFPILCNIDTICTQVGWEWLEFIMRLDPRLTWDDIDMRMEYVGARAAYNNAIITSNDVASQALKAKSKFINALQTRCSRGRAAFNMVSWRERKMNYSTNKTRDHVLKRLSADQIASNTTRGSTPGIINPLLPDTPANRVPRRRIQSQSSTLSNVQFNVQSGPHEHILAASQQAKSSISVAAALPQQYIHPTASPHLNQTQVPPTMPSTPTSRKRKAPTVSSTPLVINNTSRVDEEPLNLGRKRAKVTFIDLTENDETRSGAKSFPDNHASTSAHYADTNMRTSQPTFVGPNLVQDIVFNWPPTSTVNHTPTLPSSFALDPVPMASVPTTITYPPSGPGVSTEQQSAAVTGPNWEQGWGVFYHNDEHAPFTEVGQGYLDWGPTLPGPGQYPF